MANKIDEFLGYLQENPDKALTVEQIIDKWNISYNTAYSWMRNKYVKEERVGAKPKRIKFNFTKYNKDHQYDTNYAPTGKSVDKQIKRDVDSLLAGNTGTAHDNCIQKPNLSEEQCADILQKLIDDAVPVDLNHAVRVIMEKKRKASIKGVRSTLIQSLVVLDYMESILPDE